MPIDLKPDKRFTNIPQGTVIKAALTAATSNMNATGRVDEPNGGVIDVTHAALVGGTAQLALSQTGRYQFRVSVVATGNTAQSGTVDVTLENPPGTVLRTFSTVFNGQIVGSDPFIGRAKLLITVV